MNSDNVPKLTIEDVKNILISPGIDYELVTKYEIPNIEMDDKYNCNEEEIKGHITSLFFRQSHDPGQIVKEDILQFAIECSTKYNFAGVAYNFIGELAKENSLSLEMCDMLISEINDITQWAHRMLLARKLWLSLPHYSAELEELFSYISHNGRHTMLRSFNDFDLYSLYEFMTHHIQVCQIEQQKIISSLVNRGFEFETTVSKQNNK